MVIGRRTLNVYANSHFLYAQFALSTYSYIAHMTYLYYYISGCAADRMGQKKCQVNFIVMVGSKLHIVQRRKPKQWKHKNILNFVNIQHKTSNLLMLNIKFSTKVPLPKFIKIPRRWYRVIKFDIFFLLNHDWLFQIVYLRWCHVHYTQKTVCDSDDVSFCLYAHQTRRYITQTRWNPRSIRGPDPAYWWLLWIMRMCVYLTALCIIFYWRLVWVCVCVSGGMDPMAI